MLVELTIDQAMEMWNSIKASIQEVLPGKWKTEEHIGLLLVQAVQSGILVPWVIFETGDIIAVLTTTIQEDKITGIRNLLIYSVKSRKDKSFSDVDWDSALSTLKNYARGKGCNNIVAYTTVPYIASQVEKFGWQKELFIFTEV